MKEIDALAYAIEETEKWYSENYRRQLSVRETAIRAIILYLEAINKEEKGD